MHCVTEEYACPYLVKGHPVTANVVEWETNIMDVYHNFKKIYCGLGTYRDHVVEAIIKVDNLLVISKVGRR